MCSNWCTLYLHIVRTSFFAKLIKLAFGLKVSGWRNWSVMMNNWFFKENKTKHASFRFCFIVFLIFFQECWLFGNTDWKNTLKSHFELTLKISSSNFGNYIFHISVGKDTKIWGNDRIISSTRVAAVQSNLEPVL